MSLGWLNVIFMFMQIAPYDQLETIERLVDVPPLSPVEV